MRIIYLVLLFWAFNIVRSQIPYPPLDLSGNLINSNSDFINNNIINSTQKLNGISNVRYYAKNEINLLDGFECNTLNGDNVDFIAKINTNFLNVYSFYQNGWVANRFEKFEIGVSLPNLIDQQIEDFLLTNNGINPYDYNDIQLIGTYRNLSTNIVNVRYGFYYRDISINNNSYSNSKSIAPFRIRYSPTELGKYEVKLELKLNGQIIANFSGFFDVIESGKRGNLSIGSYNRLQDYYGAPFFAIGQNIAFANDNWVFNGVTPFDYQKQRDYISDLSQNGGNFVRVRMDPWSHDIEFEQLGVYGSSIDNFRRQWYAKELDLLFDLVEDKNIYVMLNLLQDQVFQKPGHGYPQAEPYKWQYGPYSQLISNPTDFFTNEAAIEYYKQKLFYIHSRYGYSSNLAIYELINEVDGLLKGYDVNYTSGCNSCLQFRQSVYNWSTTKIATFLNSLYPNRLRTVGFADVSPAYPNIYTNPNNSLILDLRTSNHYGFDKEVPKTRFNNAKSQLFGGTKKPFIFGEVGITDCVNSKVEPCTEVEFHNTIWSTSFTGSFGNGLYWYDWENNSKRIHFKALSAFFENIPFNTDNFEPNYNMKDDAEWIYEVNQSGSKAFGWIHNKNFYWASDPNIDLACVTCTHNQPLISCNSINEPVRINGLQSLKKYKIEIWNTYGTGGYVYNFDKKSNIFGRINFPINLSNNIGDLNPDYAFKIYKNDAIFKHEISVDTEYVSIDNPCVFYNQYNNNKFKNSKWFIDNSLLKDGNEEICFKNQGKYLIKHVYSDSTDILFEEEQLIYVIFTDDKKDNFSFVNIFPNPTNSVVNIVSMLPMNKVCVYGMQGQEINCEILPNKSNNYVLQDNLIKSNGIYFVKIYLSNGEILIKKIIVNN